MKTARRFGLFLGVLFLLFAVAGTPAEAAQPKFNQNNILSIKKGKSKKGKLKGLTKKQKSKKWKFTSSDKTVATVRRTGKYGYKITARKKKEGCAIIRAKQGNTAIYLLVLTGSCKAAPSAKTRAWASGRFHLEGAKSYPLTKSTGYEYAIEGLPDSITIAYNEEKTYTFDVGYRKIYSDGSKSKLYSEPELATYSVTNPSYVMADMYLDDDEKLKLVIEKLSKTGFSFYGGNTSDLPQQGTITIQAGNKTKVIHVTVTDWGTPDKVLTERWYKEVIHLSGADKINASNIVEYYNSWPYNGEVTYHLDEEGNVDYSDPQIICYGDDYQWSVEYAKAREIALFFSTQFKYTMNYIGTFGTAELNWLHAKKHHLPYIGYSCYANYEFEKICRYIGIDAEAISTWQIVNREDIPQMWRNYAARFNRPQTTHVLTAIRYGNGGFTLMDATPGRDSGNTGEPIDEFLARIAALPQ